MDKIKAFFQNKITKAVEIALLVVVALGLIIGGVTTDSMNSVILLVAGVADAVALLFTFISKLIKSE